MSTTLTRVVLPLPVWRIVNELYKRLVWTASRDARTILARTGADIDDAETAIRQGYVVVGGEPVGLAADNADAFARSYHMAGGDADAFLRTVQLRLSAEGHHWVHNSPASNLMWHLAQHPFAKNRIDAELRAAAVDSATGHATIVALGTAGLLRVFDPDGRELPHLTDYAVRHRGATVKLTGAGRSLHR
jgi:hypothetical protein